MAEPQMQVELPPRVKRQAAQRLAFEPDPSAAGNVESYLGGSNSAGPTTAASEPTSAAPVQVALSSPASPLTQEDIEAAVARATAEFERRYATVSGLAQSRADKLKSLEEQLQALAANNEFLAKRLDERVLPAELQLTPEEQERFGETLPFIDKILDARLTPLRAQLEAQLSDTRRRVELAAQSSAETTEQQFLNMVFATIPGLRNVVKSAEWTEFMKQAVLGTGKTAAQLFAQAHQDRDIDVLRYWHDQFVAARMQPVGAPQVKPNGSAVEPAASPVVQKPRLKYADLERATNDYRRGRLSKEKFAVVQAAFAAADKEGLVDY